MSMLSKLFHRLNGFPIKIPKAILAEIGGGESLEVTWSQAKDIQKRQNTLFLN